MIKLLGIILISFVVAGCSIVNPYTSDFSCPNKYNGKCVSVQTAYTESVNGVTYETGAAESEKREKENVCKSGDCGEGKDKSSPKLKKAQVAKKKSSDNKGIEDTGEEESTVEERNYNAYRSSLYKKFDNLLTDPGTPVVAPPKVMRVLLLPYKGQDNELYAMRHIYFFVDEPRWVLGDSIQALEEDVE